MKRREFLHYLLSSGLALGSCGSLVPLLSGCEQKKTVSFTEEYCFLDHLQEAEIRRPEPAYVRAASMAVGLEL
jgi:hypothetical protein